MLLKRLGERDTMIELLRMTGLVSLSRVINLKSLIISAMAIVSTWFCLRLEITANFPDTLIATAIVFPLVFSISTAYGRREKALEEYGTLEAHGRALFLAARDWLPESDEQRLAKLRQTLGELLTACRDMFTHPLNDLLVYEAQVHRAFSQLSLMIRQLRADGLSSTECSRCNQYVSKIIASFENIKHIYEYRTPRSLRAFSDFFIVLLPVLYGPYFAFLAAEFSRELFYVVPVLFALILVGLANIQDQLENPFDQIGEDDIAINPERFVASLQADQPDAAPIPA